VLKASAVFRLLTKAGSAGEVGLGRSGVGVLYFPLAGLILGLVLAFINRIVSPYLPTEILAAALVTILVLATAGHHLVGTQITFNNLPKRDLSVSSTDRRQLYGMLAVLLIIVFKIHSLEVIGESRAFSLMLTPLFARWSLLLFLFGSGAVAEDTAQAVAESTRSWHLVLASAMILGLALFAAGVQALWVALFLSVFALLARAYLVRFAGGISVANCGALIELGETLSFTLFTSL
jgi:adenosylcobinamide-GDP ribazoletransferase